jgi:hypothetical protein
MNELIGLIRKARPVRIDVRYRANSSLPHDVNGENPTLMTREQIIDKVAND